MTTFPPRTQRDGAIIFAPLAADEEARRNKRQFVEDVHRGFSRRAHYPVKG